MNFSSTLFRTGRAGVLSGVALVSAAVAAPASAQLANPLSSITGCEAPGNNQRNSAVIGGLVGAAAGAAVAKRDGQGAVIGGLIGAAAGSYLGCQKQRKEQVAIQPYQDYAYDRSVPYDQYGQGQSGYQRDYDNAYDRSHERTYGAHVPLARGVQPAAYTLVNERFVTNGKVNLRARPTKSSARVGQLYAGETINVVAQVRGSNWVLVGRNGVGIGYVSGSLVRPVGSDRYAGGYNR